MSVYLSMNLDGLVFSFISEEEQRYRSSACMCTYDGSDIKALMEKAVEAGKNGVQTFHASSVADEDEEEL